MAAVSDLPVHGVLLKGGLPAANRFHEEQRGAPRRRKTAVSYHTRSESQDRMVHLYAAGTAGLSASMSAVWSSLPDCVSQLDLYVVRISW